MKSRSLTLYGALVATLIAVGWTARQNEDKAGLVEPVVRTNEVAGPRPSMSKAQAHQHTVLQAASEDAFALHDWTPPPPPPPKALPPPPPPPPMAPPLPYRYVGKLMEDGRLVVFLDANGRAIAVRGDEVLDGVWRVDMIEPRLIRFTYLPLAQTATLNIGDAL